MQHEYEDPAWSWIALVEATKLEDYSARERAVNELVFRARNSQWTADLWEDCIASDEIEWGGAVIEELAASATQPYEDEDADSVMEPAESSGESD